MKLVFALLAVGALVAPASAGEVYRWIDGASVVYSDQPPQDGVVTTAMPAPEPLPVVTAPDVAPAEPTAASATASAPPLQNDVVISAAPATVDEILELSGVRPQLPNLVRSIGAGYLPAPGQLSERDGGRVAQIIARQFASQPIYAAMRDDVASRVEARHLATMAAWFRSPLARKISALEIDASKPESAEKIVAFAAGLKASPPTPARLELVQRLDWVTGTSHDTTDLTLVIVASVARASATAAPADRRARIGVIERRVEEMRPQMTAGVANNVLAQMLYVYGPLSDAELKAYVDFLGSPAGRAYSQLTHAALLRAVGDAADRTATQIARAVPPARWAAAQRIAGPAPAR